MTHECVCGAKECEVHRVVSGNACPAWLAEPSVYGNMTCECGKSHSGSYGNVCGVCYYWKARDKRAIAS